MMQRCLAASVMLLVLAAGSARADVLLTGFGGAAFGGVTDRSRGTYGGALAFLGGLFGFEFEFATVPDAFGPGGEGVFTQNDIVTLMGSFMLASPGPVRLYGAGGAGIMKTRLADPNRFFDVDSNDFGINVGGGIIGYVGEHFGLRGDVRFFRDLQDPTPDNGFDIDLGNVDYWRVVGGLTIKF